MSEPRSIAVLARLIRKPRSRQCVELERIPLERSRIGNNSGHAGRPKSRGAVYAKRGTALVWSIGCVAILLLGFAGCQRKVPPAARNSRVTQWVEVSPLNDKLAVFETVFWEPLDTESLRKLLEEQPDFVGGKAVLEIGTGSGLIALCCKYVGADHVVATDINPNAVDCARQNSRRLNMPIDVRLVPSEPPNAEPATSPHDTSAFSVIRQDEKFDVIISNPPWEDATPKQWSDYALYDQDFALLRSILVGAREHLNPGGKLVLIYGCVQAIEVAKQLAAEHNFDLLVLDDREPSSLPDVFLPGMMLGLIPRAPDSGDH